jgi:hypothetical protein
MLAKKSFSGGLNSLLEIPNSGLTCGAAEPKAAKKRNY